MAKKETKKPEKTKDKKGKNKKGAQAAVPPAGTPSQGAATGTPSGGMPTTGTPSTPLANMSPEQMTAAQIEQALKESNDPESRLKRLRSPINVRSCLLNILILIVLTLGIVTLWCFLAVDKFNFGTVFLDMMEKLGVGPAFRGFWSWLTGLFS